MPGLSPQINEIFNQDDTYYIIDVGGDDVGATVLGQYSHRLNQVGYDMFLVINKFRYQTRNIDQVITILNEIEFASKLKITGIIDNSNLGKDTKLIENSKDFIINLSEKINSKIIDLNLKNNIGESIW